MTHYNCIDQPNYWLTFLFSSFYFFYKKNVSLNPCYVKTMYNYVDIGLQDRLFQDPTLAGPKVKVDNISMK